MRQALTLERLKAKLVPGKVYRRSDLTEFSSNVDRHLFQMVSDGHLKKISKGLYLAPKSTAFGEALPDEASLLNAFLKDDHFVVYSQSQFNGLGLGTTQLYNLRVVFNRKRVGEYTLGGRTFSFYRWREAPKKLTSEFLVIELLNRLNGLPEDRYQILKHLQERLSQFNLNKLLYAASHFGTLSTQKCLTELLQLKTERKTA